MGENNKQLVDELKVVLAKAFADQYKEIHKEIVAENKAHKVNINNTLKWGIGAILGIVVMVFIYAFTSISNNRNDLVVESKKRTDLEYSVGNMDGALQEKFPESSVFGTAYEAYIRKRGGSK